MFKGFHSTARKNVLLGCLHIAIGLSIFFVWYVLDLDLLEKLTALTDALPLWTLLLAGLVEGIYWIGGIIPGLTYILLYLLGQECSVSGTGSAVLLIWLGVLTGLLVSYWSGRLMYKKTVSRDLEEKPWAVRKVLLRTLLAVYPSAAATHLFERGFAGKSLYPSFLPIIVSGLTLLSIYTVILCATKEVVRNSTGDIGLVFSGVLILWGAWRIILGLRAERLP